MNPVPHPERIEVRPRGGAVVPVVRSLVDVEPVLPGRQTQDLALDEERGLLVGLLEADNAADAVLVREGGLGDWEGGGQY